MAFTLESYFNPHLSPGSTRIDAILSITSDGGVTAGPATDRCVAFLIDCSGSMFQGGKIEAAKHALRKCIGALPAGVWFCVVAFGGAARLVVPMRQATEASKYEADKVVKGLDNLGGTEMSKALAETRKAFASRPGAACHAYFLTDGKNEGEERRVLEREVDACKGAFQCDCRGVGTDWVPDEIRLISNGLLGTSGAVADPANLEADFMRSLGDALSRNSGEVRLDLWKPGTARLVTLRQMQPENVDVTTLGTQASERVTSFRLGSWGKEQRDFCATFHVEEGGIGDELLVCRPTVAWTENGAEVKAAGTKVVATWSEDAEMTTRITPEVAHYTGQAEIASSIKEGLEARNRGNMEEATRLLGHAARIAHESGNEEVTRRLGKVVDVIDAREGTVRLKAADKGAALELDMASTRTVRRGSAA